MSFLFRLVANHSARKAAGLLVLFACASEAARAQSTPYTDIGGGLAGTNGIPQLEGFGSLYPGTTTLLHVSDAAPQEFALLSLSFTHTNVPLFGGYSQTVPATITLNGYTDDTGHAEFPITLPAGLPGPLDFYVEVFVLDGGAPQGVAITNAVHGTTVPESVIPDAAVFYDTARTAAFEMAHQGYITYDLYTYLNSAPTYFDTHPAAVLDAMTPVRVKQVTTFAATQSPAPYPGGGNGGVVDGLRWSFENLFGFEIATAQLQVPWTSTTCQSTLGTPGFAGGMPLGTFTANQVGAKWVQSCPPKEQCPHGTTAECGNFQICWKQTFVWFLTLSSGCTKAERICAPCP